MGPLEELWRFWQPAKDVAGKSLVGGMLLERVGSAALLHLPAVSTPCMGGLLCAPSGEVGRRDNFCMFCICIFIVVVIAAVGSIDLLPFTKGQMSDSLLRRSLLLHRGAVLAWKRRRRLDSTLLLQ